MISLLVIEEMILIWKIMFFSDCSSLEEIYIPDSVFNIGVNVFDNTYSLKKILY